jgi:hypothetical protein
VKYPADGTVETWDDVARLESHAPDDPVDGPDVVFRGQANSEWGLVPSILRDLRERGLCNANDADHILQAVAVEDESFSLFRTLNPGLADPREQVIWWAIAQHYGGSTRSLDWSRRIGVAVYFAASAQMNCDGALFVLRQQQLRPPKDDLAHVVHVVYNSNPARSDAGWPPSRERFCAGDPLALHVCTTHGTPLRMQVQEGFVTSCTNILSDHEDVLRAEHPKALRKFVVPKAAKAGLMRAAIANGCSAYELFADSTERSGYAQRDAVKLHGR